MVNGLVTGLASGAVSGVVNSVAWHVARMSLLSPYSVANAMIVPERISQNIQRQYFRKFTGKGKTTPKFDIYVSKLEPDKGKPVAVFLEPGAAHVVFRDEVFPLSDEVDDAYRKLRKREFGRTADVESFEISRFGAVFPTTSALPNLAYESAIHGYDIQPVSSKIFKNTWNGLMSTFPNPTITFRAGYVKPKYKVKRGSRDDAESFARNL